MQDKQTGLVGILLLLVVVALVVLPNWSRTNQIERSKRWCEDFVSLLDLEREAYANDPGGTFQSVRNKVGWQPGPSGGRLSISGGIESNGEIVVSFNASTSTHSLSSRTGWRTDNLVPVHAAAMRAVQPDDATDGASPRR